jgi:hypothetical protein
MPEGHVISYSSRQLQHQEEHYLTHDLGLAIVVLALRMWWHYLLDNVVHIFTNHKSLKYIFTQPDPNMRQWRWLELIKDYDLEVHYHPGKANVIVDALSHKDHCHYLPVVPLTEEESSIWIPPDVALFNVTLTPSLRGEIIAAQQQDVGVSHIEGRLTEGDPNVSCFHVDDEVMLWFKDRIVIPRDQGPRKKICDEAQTSKYSINPGSTQMYHDLKAQFWWTRMKCETARYVAECDTWRRVKADHLRLVGLLQPLNILAWKRGDINMDFIVGLPLTACKYDSIWGIVDRFMKSAQFLPVHTRCNVKRYAELHIERILCLHGVPNTIISDRGAMFIAHF